jgi:hypothetical protein
MSSPIKLEMKGSVEGRILNKERQEIKKVKNNNSMTYLVEKLMARNLIFNNPTNDGATDFTYREDNDAFYTVENNQFNRVFFTDYITTAQELSTLQEDNLAALQNKSGYVVKVVEFSEVNDLGSETEAIKRYAIKISFELINDSPKSLTINSMGLLTKADRIVSVLNFEDAILAPGEILQGDYIITLSIKR